MSESAWQQILSSAPHHGERIIALAAGALGDRGGDAEFAIAVVRAQLLTGAAKPQDFLADPFVK